MKGILFLSAASALKVDATSEFHMTPFLMKHTNNFMLPGTAESVPGIAKELVPEAKREDKDEVKQALSLGIV